MLPLLRAVWKKHSVAPAGRRKVNSLFWFDLKANPKSTLSVRKSKQATRCVSFILKCAQLRFDPQCVPVGVIRLHAELRRPIGAWHQKYRERDFEGKAFESLSRYADLIRRVICASPREFRAWNEPMWDLQWVHVALCMSLWYYCVSLFVVMDTNFLKMSPKFCESD